jgi:hypothetical protein
MRCQQVYDASQFSQVPTNGGFVTVIYFRVDSFGGYGFGETLPNIQINLSTTGRSADALSTNFIYRGKGYPAACCGEEFAGQGLRGYNGRQWTLNLAAIVFTRYAITW